MSMSEEKKKQMQENMKLRNRVQELGEEIAGDIHHGECFYEKEMLEEFIGNLNDLIGTAQAYYESNRKELENDE